MGVSIHYSGKLDDLSTINHLMDELEDIANSIGWECARLDEDWNAPFTAQLVHSDKGAVIEGDLCLKGVILDSDDNTESLPFLFNSKGDMTSIIGALNEDPYDKIVSVKTQYGSNKTHIWIIGLLKYVQSKYVKDLDVTDEGGIWQGGSEQQLDQKKAFISGMIDSLAQKLTQSDLKSSNLPDLLKEIEKIVQDIQRNITDNNPPQQGKAD